MNFEKYAGCVSCLSCHFVGGDGKRIFGMVMLNSSAHKQEYIKVQLSWERLVGLNVRKDQISMR